MSATRKAFTLIELLVVVGIIALLFAILLPSLGRARQRALSTRCLANLKGIGTGLVAYDSLNNGFVVPAYNMTGYGGVQITLDGWPAILDRDGVVPGYAGITANVFYCPCTTNVIGTAVGAGSNVIPTGYQDWPVTLTAGTDTGGQVDPALPVAGFGDNNGLYQHEIRTSYWINANNPIGTSQKKFSPQPYYTTSVGYTYSDTGPVGCTKSSTFTRPSALVVLADGVYAGQQGKTRLIGGGSRVGYRHLGASATANSSANAVFADGHAESLESSAFPTTGADPVTGIVPGIGAYTVLAAQ